MRVKHIRSQNRYFLPVKNSSMNGENACQKPSEMFIPLANRADSLSKSTFFLGNACWRTLARDARLGTPGSMKQGPALS